MIRGLGFFLFFAVHCIVFSLGASEEAVAGNQELSAALMANENLEKVTVQLNGKVVELETKIVDLEKSAKESAAAAGNTITALNTKVEELTSEIDVLRSNGAIASDAAEQTIEQLTAKVGELTTEIQGLQADGMAATEATKKSNSLLNGKVQELEAMVHEVKKAGAAAKEEAAATISQLKESGAAATEAAAATISQLKESGAAAADAAAHTISQLKGRVEELVAGAQKGVEEPTLGDMGQMAKLWAAQRATELSASASTYSADLVESAEGLGAKLLSKAEETRPVVQKQVEGILAQLPPLPPVASLASRPRRLAEQVGVAVYTNTPPVVWEYGKHVAVAYRTHVEPVVLPPCKRMVAAGLPLARDAMAWASQQQQVLHEQALKAREQAVSTASRVRSEATGALIERGYTVDEASELVERVATVATYTVGVLIVVPLLRLALRLVCWGLCMLFHMLTFGLFYGCCSSKKKARKLPAGLAARVKKRRNRSKKSSKAKAKAAAAEHEEEESDESSD